jgi:hypothetical protein
MRQTDFANNFATTLSFVSEDETYRCESTELDLVILWCRTPMAYFLKYWSTQECLGIDEKIFKYNLGSTH